VGLDPAALEEPRRGDPAVGEDVENRLGPAGPVGAIGMLGVKGQRDPERSADARLRGYFSTPVITIPRVNTRWKIRKITIGMIIVMIVPA
jgi:hypothetical protein